MKLIIDRFLKHIQDLPEQHKMLVSIRYSADMISKHFEIILGKYSLTPPQYNVLRILQAKHPKPSSVIELRDMIIDKKSDVSRLVERLRKSGFADRKINPNDKRAVEVIITQQGLDVLDRIMKQQGSNMFGPFYNLNDAEAKQINELLQKLLNGLKGVLPED